MLNKDMNNWTVLIVDDEPDNLAVATKVLSFSGATVHTASNALTGLDMLHEITPTFILLDLSMPEMDGWEMLEKIRQDLTTADIPVIALTAHAMQGDREKALEAGFDDYIIKPFRIPTLLSAIQDCLERVVWNRSEKG